MWLPQSWGVSGYHVVRDIAGFKILVYLCVGFICVVFWPNYSKQGMVSEVTYGDDVVLLSEIVVGLGNKFWKWMEAFDSEGLNSTLGKPMWFSAEALWRVWVLWLEGKG